MGAIQLLFAPLAALLLHTSMVSLAKVELPSLCLLRQTKRTGFACATMHALLTYFFAV